MINAFKTYSQAPASQIPEGIPLDWPWVVARVPDEHAPAFLAEGFSVLNDDAFSAYKMERLSAFNTWKTAYEAAQVANELRVAPLVDEKFSMLPPSKIDFRRHLKDNIYLQKNVIMLPNGRPQKAVYSYNGENIAEIEFVFQVDAFNFMTRRTEKLSYYKNSGGLSEQWVIADDIYSQSNPYHLREIMKERSESRALIIEEIKAFLNGVLAQYYLPQGKTYVEILEIAGNFWGVYSTPIDSWINVGSPQFKDMLTVDTAFPFLDHEIATGLTVRAYILNKTSY